MKNIIILLVSFLIFLTTYAQVSEMMGFRDYRDIADAYNVRLKENANFKIEDIEGSPFLDEDFKKGYIIDTKSENKAQTYLRYDVFNDIFEIRLDPNSESIKTLNRSPIYHYNIDGERFVLIESENAINENHYVSGNGYVVELISPDAGAGLYKRYYSKLDSGTKALTSYQKDIMPSIKNKVRYIIKIDNTYENLDDHRKRILDAFPKEKQGIIKKYIKNKKFKFQGSEKEIQNEMIQVVRYYNSL